MCVTYKTVNGMTVKGCVHAHKGAELLHALQSKGNTIISVLVLK